MAAATLEWQSVQQKVRSQPWAAAIVTAMEASFEQAVRAWPGDPTLEQSDWTHHYYCDDDAARLVFDIAKPNEHVCSRCGRIYRGYPWDGAWRTQLHGMFVGTVERAAILARLKPAADAAKYVAYVRRVVTFYAEHYADYPVHGKHAGRGKIMPQSLDEAILLLSLARYLQWGQGQNWFSADETARINDRLFRPAIDLLKPQVSKIHNIHAWIQSALAAAAVRIDDLALLDWTINSEFGWRNQLEKGCNDDGFWYEGSVSYHFYSFNALSSHAMTAAEAGIDLFSAPKLARMLKAPLGLAFSDGTLPAHNDCWPGNRLVTPLYELGAWAWPDQKFEDDLAWVSATGPVPTRCAGWLALADPLAPRGTGEVRCSTHALLFGPSTIDVRSAPKPVSHHFPASGIAILQNDIVRVCLRSGPDGGGHDHNDKLNVDVRVQAGKHTWEAADLGTSGYGAAITAKWYRTPAAHCTVVVNESRQASSDGRIESFDATHAVGVADRAYAGARLRREIALTPTGWDDSFTVDCDAEATLDWFFHGLGTLDLSVASAGMGQLSDELGYAWLRDVRRGTADVDWTATWTSPAGVMRVRFKAAAGTEIFTAIGDDNPAGKPLAVLVVRRRAARTTFDAAFRFEPVRS